MHKQDPLSEEYVHNWQLPFHVSQFAKDETVQVPNLDTVRIFRAQEFNVLQCHGILFCGHQHFYQLESQPVPYRLDVGSLRRSR